MGIDLTLLPLLERDYWVSHDLLRLERQRELWPLVQQLNALPVPNKLSCFVATGADGEARYGLAVQDKYGEPLRYTTVSELLKLSDNPSVQDHWKNRAIWAALAEMPSNWKIVLWWH